MVIGFSAAASPDAHSQTPPSQLKPYILFHVLNINTLSNCRLSNFIGLDILK